MALHQSVDKPSEVGVDERGCSFKCIGCPRGVSIWLGSVLAASIPDGAGAVRLCHHSSLRNKVPSRSNAKQRRAGLQYGETSEHLRSLVVEYSIGNHPCTERRGEQGRRSRDQGTRRRPIDTEARWPIRQSTCRSILALVCC